MPARRNERLRQAIKPIRDRASDDGGGHMYDHVPQSTFRPPAGRKVNRPRPPVVCARLNGKTIKWEPGWWESYMRQAHEHSPGVVEWDVRLLSAGGSTGLGPPYLVNEV